MKFVFDNAATNCSDDEWKFVVGLWLRVIAAGVFVLFLAPFTLLGIDFPYGKCSFAYYGLLGLIVVNAPYWVIGKVRGFPLGDFYAHWAIDLVLITITMYGLGGCLLPSSITAYILIVITSAVLISRNASFAVATGAAAAYGGSAAAEALGWIDPPYDLGLPTFSSGMNAFTVGAPIFMVYLVAFITGTLSEQLKKANALLRFRNDEMRDRNVTLDRTRGELEFQSNVLSHDIRSPVAAAMGAIGEIQKSRQGEGVDDEMGELLQLAIRNLSRVEDMIEGLDEAREGLEWRENFQSVDLAEVVNELIVEFREEIRRRKATLLVEAGLPTVIGRRERFIVMLRNLIGNALRYIPEDGTGRIRVGIREEEREWLVFVEDNGCGVPLQFQVVIFEMFRKGPQVSKSGGIGLGLALVKKVAEQHGGKAWVESDGASGATFWVGIAKEQERERRTAERTGDPS